MCDHYLLNGTLLLYLLPLSSPTEPAFSEPVSGDDFESEPVIYQDSMKYAGYVLFLCSSWNKPWRPRVGVHLYSFFNLGIIWWWVVNAMPWLLYPPPSQLGDPVPIVQEVGWAPWLVWIGVENIALSGFDPQTVHHTGSCYTDYAILPTMSCDITKLSTGILICFFLHQ
jgi:hypothetical protein